MKNYSENELKKIVSNYKEHSLNTIKLALNELENKGSSINNSFLKKVKKHFKLDVTEVIFNGIIIEDLEEDNDDFQLTDDDNILENNFNNNIEISSDKLFLKISDLVSSYKIGFGLVFSGNLIMILTGFMVYIVTKGNNDIDSLKGIIQFGLLISILGGFLYLIGIFILYSSSNFKNNGN
jgi:hypothetical protein